MTFRAVVRDTLRKFGTQITVTTQGDRVYDPASGGVMVTGQVSKNFYADITQASDYKGNLEVEHGDLVATIPYQDFHPDTDGIVSLNGKSYRVLLVNSVFAFDEITAFELQLRRVS